MSKDHPTFRVTLIWPPHACIQTRKNAQGHDSKFGRDVFPNCTEVSNDRGYLAFTDSLGKRRMARMMFLVEEE